MSKQICLLDRLEDFINDYLPNVKGLSANTVKSYKDTFRLMIIYFEDKKGISCKKLAFIDLNVENIKEFLKWLEEDRNCSSSTRNQRLAALSQFMPRIWTLMQHQYIEAQSSRFLKRSL